MCNWVVKAASDVKRIGVLWLDTSILIHTCEEAAMKCHVTGLIVFGAMLCAYQVQAQTSFWRQTNGPDGGSVYSLQSDGNGNIYANAYSAVFRSSDRGQHWDQSGLRTALVASLAVNGQGDVFAGSNNLGMFRSTDHGTTWTAINAGLTEAWFPSVAVAGNGDIYAGSGTGNLFRSTDNGDRWGLLYTTPSGNRIYSIVFNQLGHIFLGTVFPGGGVFRSTDAGLSWQPVNDGLTTTDVYSLDLNPGGDLFAATRGGGVFRSTDNGTHWMAVNNGITYLFMSYLEITQGVIYAGSYFGLFRSTDNGDSWVQLANGLTNGQILSLLAYPDGFVIAGTMSGTGVFRSTDGGDNWTQSNNGLRASTIAAIAANSATGLLVTDQNTGVFRSTNNGTTWNRVYDDGHSGFVRRVLLTQIGTAYASVSSGIIRSTNSGASWSQVLATSSIRDVGVAGNGNIFAAGNGLYRSTDDGLTWSIDFTGSPFYTLGIAPNGTVFAGTRPSDNRRIVRSTDNGVSWEEVWSGSGYFFESIAFNSLGHVFATDGSQGTILCSTDNGGTWSPLNVAGATSEVRAVVVNADQRLYCATRDGVYRSTDNGDSWSIMSTGGLVDTDVKSFAIDADGYLLAGTVGGGVFRTTSPITDVPQTGGVVPLSFSLEQNYPNPFNPRTIIEFSVPQSGDVHLGVFNVLGQEVASLVSEYVQPGKHQASWDATGVGSGVYFYRLQAGGFVQSRRLVLLK